MNGGCRFDIYGYPERLARIFPRRKSGEKSRARTQPIVLSRQALEPLFDRPLREAAISLGVSCTALKTICRKLRIERWPFQQSRWFAMRAGKTGEEAIPGPAYPAVELDEDAMARKATSASMCSKGATSKADKVNDFDRLYLTVSLDDGLDDGNMGEIFGSLEMSYNSRRPSPVYDDLRHEDVAGSASKLACEEMHHRQRVNQLGWHQMSDISSQIRFEGHMNMNRIYDEERQLNSLGSPQQRIYSQPKVIQGTTSKSVPMDNFESYDYTMCDLSYLGDQSYIVT
jgi:hypothetical protein